MAKVYDEVFSNFGITDAIIDLLNGYDFGTMLCITSP